MTAFHDVRFPEGVSFGSRGGPMFKTQVYTSHRGYEFRNSDWAQPLMQFDVSFGVKTDEDMMEVLEFFNARQGRAFGFRYKNWADYSIINRPFCTGDGLSTRLPIFKFFGSQDNRFYKRLRKIVPGSVTGVQAGAEPLVEGVDFSIDYNSGEAIFNEVIGYGRPVYCATLEYDEPVRFEDDSIQAVIDDWNNQSLGRLSLIGLRGTYSEGSVFAPDDSEDGTDGLFEHVALELNFDDVATGLTSTVDGSLLAHPVTFSGTSILSATTYMHGEGSFSAGDNGYISVSGNYLDLSSRPFSIELFARQPDTGEDFQTIIGKWDTATSKRCWQLRYDHKFGRLQFVASTDGADERVILQYPWASGNAEFYDYITVDREINGWWTLRINGVVLQNARDSLPIHDDSTGVHVGGLPLQDVDNGSFRASIDSLRLTLGVSRHPAQERIDIPTVI